jgi:T5SS/PEP-CTERM-associated repeat protein
VSTETGGGRLGWRSASGLLLCAAVSTTLAVPAVAEVKLVGDTSPKTPGPTLPNLFVGIVGSGSLDITAGSTLTVDKTTSFGLDTGSEGTGTITGAGSKLTSDVINLGLCGTGVLRVSGGGAVSATTITVGTIRKGASCGGNGQLSVAGIGSTVTASGNLEVGVGNAESKGLVTIGAGSTMTVGGNADIGKVGRGSVVASGTMTVKGNASIGTGGGSGSLSVTGGKMRVGDVFIGDETKGSFGRLNVTNDGRLYSRGNIVFTNDSVMTVNDDSTVFARGNVTLASSTPADLATLNVTGGSKMTADNVMLKSNSSVTVGNESRLVAGRIRVGAALGTNAANNVKNATLTIEGGGVVDADVIVRSGGTLNGKKGVKQGKTVNDDKSGNVTLEAGPLDLSESYAQNGGTLQIDLDGPNSFATVDVAGTGAFSAGSSLVFDFAGFRPTVGESFTFFDALGGVNVTPSADNCVNGEFECGFVGVPSTLDFEVLSAPDTLTLVVTGGTAVPEPREACLLLLGFAALAGRRLLAGRPVN